MLLLGSKTLARMEKSNRTSFQLRDQIQLPSLHHLRTQSSYGSKEVPHIFHVAEPTKVLDHIMSMHSFPTDLVSDVRDILSALWAAPTWQARDLAFRQFTEFLSGRNLPWTEATAITWLASMIRDGYAPSTVLGKGSALSALWERLQPQSLAKRLFLDFIAGLRRIASRNPITQALPFNPLDLEVIMLALRQPEDQVSMILCLLTNSRWADILALTQESVEIISGSTILIVFPHTKSSAQEAFRPDHIVLIDFGLHLIPHKVLTVIRKWKKKEPGPITSLTTAALDKRLARIKPTSQQRQTSPLVQLRDHYTAHSAKHFVTGLLWEWAARREIPVALVALMAKHKMDWEAPAVTVRYAPSMVTVAQAFQTHVATNKIFQMLRMWIPAEMKGTR